MCDNNADKWWTYSQACAKEPVSKFVMLWIAFNWLYSEFSDGGLLSERKSIRLFCKSRDNCKRLLDYDPFGKDGTDAIDIFLGKPVLDGRYEKYANSNNPCGKKKYEKALEEAKEIHNKLRDKDPLERMINLLLTIYQVRCNLFHGSKTPLGPRQTRDADLIEASGEIMEGYMRKLLNKDAWSLSPHSNSHPRGM